MAVPDFATQIRIDDDVTDLAAVIQEWIAMRCDEFRKEGATFFRASVHPDDGRLALVEGWKFRPEDQGEPRFFLTAA